jgi:hypothetical protein
VKRIFSSIPFVRSVRCWKRGGKGTRWNETDIGLGGEDKIGNESGRFDRKSEQPAAIKVV